VRAFRSVVSKSTDAWLCYIFVTISRIITEWWRLLRART